MGNCCCRHVGCRQENGTEKSFSRRPSSFVHPIMVGASAPDTRQEIKGTPARDNGEFGRVRRVKLVISAKDLSRFLSEGNSDGLRNLILEKLSGHEHEEVVSRNSTNPRSPSWRPSLADIPENHSSSSLSFKPLSATV